MRAVRFGDGKVQVIDAPEPSGDGVLVEIRSAGICGSDLNILSLGYPIPYILGHEFAGVLEDGTAVAIEPITPCGECEFCVDGRYNLCRVGLGMLMGIQQDGGMADRIRVPERCLVPLPPGVSPREACIVEPLAVAVHGIREAGIQAGQRVAVIGAGSVGLCAVVAAQNAGADVSLVARHESQRQAGRDLGAKLEADGEFEVVIDCAGNAGALETAAKLCRPAGTLLLIATYWGGMQLPGFLICLKEIRCVPSSLYSNHHEGSDFELAARIVAERSDLSEIMITHRLPLDEAARGFELGADRKSGAIKVVLEV